MGKRLYSFFSSLSDVSGLPFAELVSESTGEIVGRRECVFFGVRKIRSFDRTSAVLKLCEGDVCVRGESLRLAVFGGGAVRIKGRIGLISFGEDKK